MCELDAGAISQAALYDALTDLTNCCLSVTCICVVLFLMYYVGFYIKINECRCSCIHHVSFLPQTKFSKNTNRNALSEQHIMHILL